MKWNIERLPEKILNLRRHLNISQANLADGIGITRACVCNYEGGKNTPPIDFMIKICNRYDIDPYYWYLCCEKGIDYLNSRRYLNKYCIDDKTSNIDLFLRVIEAEKTIQNLKDENQALKDKILSIKRLTEDVKKRLT
jgi:transcriptional regulator with XRE-family HTH domain